MLININKNFKFILKLTFTLFIIVYLILLIDFKKIEFKKIEFEILLYIFIINVINYILIGIRFQNTIGFLLKKKFSIFKILEINAISTLAANILPSPFEEVTRLASLKKKYKDFYDSSSVIFADRLQGLLVKVFYLFISFLIFFFYFKKNSEIFFIPLIFFLLIIIKFKNTFVKFLSKLKNLMTYKFKIILEKFFRLKNTKFFLLNIILTLIVHFNHYFVAYLISLTIYPETNFLLFLMVFPISAFILMFPFTISKWGFRELIMIKTLSIIGLSKELSLVISIYIGLIDIIMASLFFLLITAYNSIYKN